jgi:hypothetical protein
VKNLISKIKAKYVLIDQFSFRNFGKPFKFTFTVLLLVSLPLAYVGLLAPESPKTTTVTTPSKPTPVNPTRANPYGELPNSSSQANSSQTSFLPTENLAKAVPVGLTQALSMLEGQDSTAWVDAGNGRTLIEINKTKNIVVSYPLSYESSFISQLLTYPVSIQPINNISPIVKTYSDTSSRGIFILLVAGVFIAWVFIQRRKRLVITMLQQ